MLQYNTLLRNFIFLYSRYIFPNILANLAVGVYGQHYRSNNCKLLLMSGQSCMFSYVIVMIIIVRFSIIIALILLTERQRLPPS